MKQTPLKLPPKSTLGQRLKTAMDVRGMKAPTLASRTGLTRQGIYGLIKGRTLNPDSNLVMLICEELLIRPEWLLREKGPMVPSPELSDEESTLIYAFRELDPEDRGKLLRVANSFLAEGAGPPSRSNPFKK